MSDLVGSQPSRLDEQIGLEPLRVLSSLLALLRAGASPDSPAASPPPELAPAQWAQFLTLARKHGLSALLYHAIQTLHRTDVPQDILTALHETVLRTNLAQLLAYDELGALLDAFSAANIPVIVLKGAALALTLYPDPALRPFGDLDLLVHEANLPRASEILLQRQYQAVVEMSAGTDSALWGQQTFVRPGARPARVELHWHLFVLSYYRRRARLAWFWERRAPFSVQGRTAYMFDPSAQLLHLSSHTALHHSDTRLIWLYDLALLVAQQGAQLDWGKTIETAQSFGLTLALRQALLEMSAAYQVALPAQAEQILAQTRVSRVERWMFALARSKHRQARWIADGVGVGGTYWLTHLFPAPAYMRERYQIRHNALLPLYYAARPFSGTYKFVRAILGLVFKS